MSRFGWAAILLLALSTPPALSQDLGLDRPRSYQAALSLGLLPPDVIMRHQQALGITPEQRRKMLQLVRRFQSEVGELQWNLEDEQQKLREALSPAEIDQDRVMPMVERVLQLESEFKLAHMRLLIAIKNELTGEQVAMIEERIRQRRP